jgi:release factor glutamine methyltransferase
VRVAEALRDARARLRAAGVEAPDHDAELLLRHVLGWDRARLIAAGDDALDAAGDASFRALVFERAGRRPLQHLTGTQWFWKDEFAVSPDVLIPRPETEVLLEAGLAAVRDVPRPVVVDVGTGSGCLALSLARERADAVVHAVDVSEAALAVARSNARRLGLADRVAFHQGDLLGPLHSFEGALDLVLANPPYVAAEELAALAPEVRDHEPRLALVPPGDRYTAYRGLAPAAFRLLRPGGHVGLEVGAGMAQEVERILDEAGLPRERIVLDLAGIPRVVIAVRPIVHRPPICSSTPHPTLPT